jgi:dihydropteroate synthase
MKKLILVRGRLVDLSTPVVMGILNITSDSFFDGGKFKEVNSAVLQTKKMLDEGAGIIDIGAQSTRPNATLISSEEEWRRLELVLKTLRKEFPDAIFSVDTFYSEIAEKAIDAGADMINDISGGTVDEKMFSVIARYKIPYVLMHMQGTPQTMQQNPQYNNITKEVMGFFAQRIQKLISLGVNDIILDVGFGFGKTLERNYELLSHLELFKFFERPMLVGLSRKSMVNKVLGIKSEDALNGTTVLNTIALMKGANILRVHDVNEAAEAIKLVNCISK